MPDWGSELSYLALLWILKYTRTTMGSFYNGSYEYYDEYNRLYMPQCIWNPPNIKGKIYGKCNLRCKYTLQNDKIELFLDSVIFKVYIFLVVVN